jgi:hypothetical protein
MGRVGGILKICHLVERCIFKRSWVCAFWKKYVILKPFRTLVTNYNISTHTHIINTAINTYYQHSHQHNASAHQHCHHVNFSAFAAKKVSPSVRLHGRPKFVTQVRKFTSFILSFAPFYFLHT